MRGVGRAFTPLHAWGHRFNASVWATWAFSVHPHTRGDIDTSSYRSDQLVDDGRFTPTRVGTAIAVYNAMEWPDLVSAGSPPHAWGRHNDGGTSSGISPHVLSPLSVHPHTRGDIDRIAARRVGFQARFTPTRVGTLLNPRIATLASWSVHPHTRGDIVSRHVENAGVAGSPPHAWGHRRSGDRRNVHSVHLAVHPHTRGDIVCTPSAPKQLRTVHPPTRVGTFWLSLDVLRPTVHPHTRGDIPVRNDKCWRGSLPHTRGDILAPRWDSSVHPHTRGDIWGLSRRKRSLSTVHPHTRGDIPTLPRSEVDPSVHPHSRGDIKFTSALWASRSVPATVHPHRRVGHPADRDSLNGQAVHPHTRGDIASVFPDAMSRPCRTTGSPPHAWGHLVHVRRRSMGSVHPHTRGDIARSWWLSRPLCAVHPHTRGDIAVDVGSGICRAVHPHTRGDISPQSRRRIWLGSPPHAWGHLCTVLVNAHGLAHAVHPHTRGDIAQAKSIRRRAHRFTPTRVGTSTWRRRGGERRFTPTRVGGHPLRRFGFGPRCLYRFTPTRVGTSLADVEAPGLQSVHPHTRGDIREIRRPRKVGPRFTPTRVGTLIKPHLAVPIIAGSPPHAWGH